jgi:hypothetical protein
MTPPEVVACATELIARAHRVTETLLLTAGPDALIKVANDIRMANAALHTALIARAVAVAHERAGTRRGPGKVHLRGRSS